MRYIILLIAILCLALSPTLVSAQESGSLPPCRFYGAVRIDSAYVADGTVITAIVQGNTYTTTTPSIYGDSTYAIVIIPPEGTVYSDGASVTFIIGNYYAFETGIWETGLNIPLNLTASTTLSPTITPSPTPLPAPTLTPVPTQTPSAEITSTPTIPPTPAPPVTQINKGRLTGVIIFGIIAILLLAILIYLVWRLFLRREKQP
ncbi:MAG: hypothetical protein FJ004_07840 [Chloroflexi bacterium]|nr:hypothetical protein [Chloroflexota bacterium]